MDANEPDPTDSASDRSDFALNLLRAWDERAVRHGFLGRLGGVSRGPFATLNLSYHVGDRHADIDENWRRVRSVVPAHGQFALMNQVHGNTIRAIDGAWRGERPRADGLVTSMRRIMLGVLSADCVPILLADSEAGIVGALHAGWRGTLAGIADEGMRAMVALGAAPRQMRVALGPSIGPCCFEVDESLGARFRDEVAGIAQHITTGRPGKSHIDLRALIADQLERAGVGRDAISIVRPCTQCASDRYFSRRAAAVRRESNGNAVTTGLQLSFIGLPE